MADAKAAETPAAAAPASPGKELIQAERAHLQPGQLVYIRGKEALLIDVDFPNVFWSFTGEEVIKHRSFNANPKMFQVTKGTVASLNKRKQTTGSEQEWTDSDNDDEAFSKPSPGADSEFAAADFAAFDNGAPGVDAAFAAFEDDGNKKPAGDAPPSS
jgi:hypothetical protein